MRRVICRVIVGLLAVASGCAQPTNDPLNTPDGTLHPVDAARAPHDLAAPPHADLTTAPDDLTTSGDALRIVAPDQSVNPVDMAAPPADFTGMTIDATHLPDLAAPPPDATVIHDFTTAPQDMVCVPSCPANYCGSNLCGGMCTCGTGMGCESGKCTPLPQTFSVAGPPPAASPYNGNYAKEVFITLAADDPSTIIYYTTDGSPPTTSSAHALTPVKNIDIAVTTTLRYFGVSPAGTEPTPHSDHFGVDATTQQYSGYVTRDDVLDGTTPVVIATPGQVLKMASSQIRVWVPATTPSVGAQLVYMVDGVAQGCLWDGGPGAYPGTVVNQVVFTVTAPMKSGTHPVTVAHIEDFSCTMALSDPAVPGRPNITRLGVIVVR